MESDKIKLFSNYLITIQIFTLHQNYLQQNNTPQYVYHEEE
jgi:hypothetical protein